MAAQLAHWVGATGHRAGALSVPGGRTFPVPEIAAAPDAVDAGASGGRVLVTVPP